MDSLGVLMTRQMSAYLEEELDKRCKLFRLWDSPPERRMEFLRAHAPDIRAVVADSYIGAHAETIEALPRLEIIATFSVGLDQIDLGNCKEKGIRVTSTPDVLTDDVADLAVGLAIAALRQLCDTDQYVRSGEWKAKGAYKLTSKFSGKTVGIIGLGRIGLAIAKRVEGFGCPISYYSRTEKPATNYKYYPSAATLAAKCQVLIVACSLTEETVHIVDRKVLDALGPKGVLVNVGRGAHVDEPELVAALREGRLGGAGLDVFEGEPRVPEELFGLKNVVLAPHVGCSTLETIRAMADLVLANLEAHAAKKPLVTPVV